MAKFGSKCFLCKNYAEVKLYPGFDNAICEDCFRTEQDYKSHIETKQPQPSPTQKTDTKQVGERERYIQVICDEASPEWVDKFIKEVLASQVLQYDWKTIIGNERWFSVLNLRRFALDINPNLDKPKPVDKIPSVVRPTPVRRKKSNQATVKETLNA